MITEYRQYTDEMLIKYFNEAADLMIKADIAHSFYVRAAKRKIQSVMDERGIVPGMKIEVDGENVVVVEPVVTWKENAPALRCAPLTKKGTASKTEIIDVFISGILSARIIKE